MRSIPEEKGQSLIEVLATLAVAVIVILAWVQVIITSIRNTAFAKNQALATRHAQETIERVRAYRDELDDWTLFVTNCQPSDLPSLPSLFERSIDCYPPDNPAEGTGGCAGNDSCEVKVTVSWTDSQGTHGSELKTRLTNWK